MFKKIPDGTSPFLSWVVTKLENSEEVELLSSAFSKDLTLVSWLFE